MMADDYPTQRLYWYRRQRLSHPPIGIVNDLNLPVYQPPGIGGCRYEMPPSIPNITAAPNIGVCSTAAPTCMTLTSLQSDPEYTSCRYASPVSPRSDGGRRTSSLTSSSSVSSTQGKSSSDNQQQQGSSRQTKNKLPPLDISEVIETLTTLASNGKMKKSDSDTDSDDKLGITASRK